MTRPTVFSADIGGYGGPSYSVKLVGDTLRYEHTRDGTLLDAEMFEPTSAQWGAFLASLEAAQVWSWKRRYHGAGIVDGTSWSFVLEAGGRRKKSGGSNDFPPTFDQAMGAISQLVGGRDFR